MVHVRGHWTPDVDFNVLSRRVLEALAEKPSRLTGVEVRFIRQSMSMTLEGFARRFGVTHPAVLKWEGRRNEPTAMSWAIEKDIRLEVLRSFESTKPTDFVAAYRELSTAPAARPARIRLDLKRPA
jgi:DNA-binding transcriptional regulator YiaG